MTATRPVVAAGSGRVLIAGGVVAAVVAIVVLVWPTPPGPAVLHTGTSHYVITAIVDSPRIGSTAVEIDLAGRDGPAGPVAVRVQAVMPLMGYATPPVTAVPVGGGRYRADGVPLMLIGQWELLLSIGVDHLTLPLTVGG
jgi:hypothetical protein